jgi:CheY-like chemotaxis protein
MTLLYFTIISMSDGIEATSRFRQREAAAKSGDMTATGDADKNINQDVATLSPNHLLIIGMSANSDAESKQCAKDAGMDYFIEKPFVMADFLKVLDACSADCSVSMMS